jgi:hypothetical protein
VLDANKDGAIDGFENGDYETKVAPEIQPHIGGLERQDAGRWPGDDEGRRNRGEDRPRKRKGGFSGPRGAGSYGLIDEPQPVRTADVNLDFRVSEAEWRAAADRRFARLDLDQDGRLTWAELPQTPAQAMSEGVDKEKAKAQEKAREREQEQAEKANR